jgi:hypothetical protein
MNIEFLRDLTHVIDCNVTARKPSVWNGFQANDKKSVISISMVGTKIIANILSRKEDDVKELNGLLTDDKIFNLKDSVGECETKGQAYLDYVCISAIENEIRLRGKLNQSEKAL